MQCSEHFNLRVVIVSSDIHLQSNLMMMTGVSLRVPYWVEVVCSKITTMILSPRIVVI